MRARAAADRLASIAADGREPGAGRRGRHRAWRVEAASGERDAAVVAYEAAQRRLATGERPLLVGLVRLELAEVFAANDDESHAVAEARAALAAFERLGATSYRDRARALLRSLGVGVRMRDRSGPVLLESLTARESEVLDLVRQGYSNADIAGRLFISPKTAEHHVGRILNKLGVRSRAEAAALAATSDPGPNRGPLGGPARCGRRRTMRW